MKTKRSNSKTVLRNQIQEFFEFIIEHAESPENWPLSAAEQVAFIRKTMQAAKNISETDAFQREKLLHIKWLRNNR